MYLPRYPRTRSRRGVILMVVLALLTLFAVVGVTFVLYSQRQADAARVYREYQALTSGDAPEMLLDEFLRQWIYDVDDVLPPFTSGPGVTSALRGHSLARGMFGQNGTTTTAYNGTGRLHYTHPASPPAPYTFLGGQDEYNLINYQFFSADTITHDPERLKPGAVALPGPENFWGGVGAGTWRSGFNANYTYPDNNNVFLAAVDANGNVLQRSYHRPGIWGAATNDPLNQANLPNSGTPHPDWTSPAGKYKIMTPRPNEHPQFPAPGAGGHVKNLLGSPGGNDSVWIDIGSPVRQLPDGRYYKPLFAPLIVDLDNRVNLNMHGNYRFNDPINGPTHVSNMGIGPWEVSLSQVLNAGTEWRNLLGGVSPQQPGRYGYSASPNPAQPDLSLAGPGGTLGIARFYGRYDYDGYDNGTLAPPPDPAGQSGMIQTAANGFPTFGLGYDSGSGFPGMPLSPPTPLRQRDEYTNHPQFFNIFAPGGDDRVFPHSNMQALLRDCSSLNDVTSIELYKLCPTNFSNAKMRRLVTTISYDLDQPGVTPWLYPGSAPMAPTAYTITAGNYPTGAAIGFPSPLPAPTSNWSDAARAALGRVDLNGPLADYPGPDPATGEISLAVPPVNPNPTGAMDKYTQALQERQALANNVYDRLLYVTGDPATTDANAKRWLAQLAVNIVDYIDTDEYMTPFEYGGPGSGVFVFGTEMPRLVVNEAYIEIANDPNDTFDPMTKKALNDYQVNCWVELHNPLLDDPTYPDPAAAIPGGAKNCAWLQLPNGTKAYQLEIYVDATAANFQQRTNILGTSDGTNQTVVNDFTANPVVFPWNGVSPGPQGGKNGFYVIGPTTPFPEVPGPSTVPNASLKSANMTYLVAKTEADPVQKVRTHTVLLRRLACPYRPAEPNAALPTYNPFITVDYVEAVPTQTRVTNDSTGELGQAKVQPPFKDATGAVGTGPQAAASIGRSQPYGAFYGGDSSKIYRDDATYVAAGSQQQMQTKAQAAQPKHTFFESNIPATSPYNWLAHLDRKLVSPMELLHVSAFKPHELTQQFINGAGTTYQQVAPWFVNDSRLYRVFEFLETKGRDAATQGWTGGSNSSRVPGKININTIWRDPPPASGHPIFSALCDAQSGNSNSFTAADVNGIFDAMVALRDGPDGIPGTPDDRPFVGMAAPYDSGGAGTQYPLGSGIDSTFLRAGGVGRLFEAPTAAAAAPPNNHPYLRYQLMNKIYNNVTTRSNVFALWLTVGFFEVVNTGTTPVQLGAELDANIGRNIRHHMFAIADRSALTYVPNPLAPLPPPALATAATNATPGISIVTLAAAPVPPLQVGQIISVDSGAYQETVIVSAVAGASFTAKFNKPHTAPFSIYSTVPGHNGPKPTFRAIDNNLVVPHYAIID